MRIIVLLVLLLSSCKTFQTGSGGGGGSIPSTDEVLDYITRTTGVTPDYCSDMTIDDPGSSKRGKVVIYPAGAEPWGDNYTRAIEEQFNKDYMFPLRQQKLAEEDLTTLGCLGYNTATREEKKRFWVLFLASLSKPESDMKAGDNTSGNLGLLQIDVRAANQWCKVLAEEIKRPITSSDLYNPEINLKCGLIMMQHQVLGVLLGHPPKQTEPQLEGRVFTGKTTWYWGPLRDSEPKQKQKIIDMFRVHAQVQFPFCRKSRVDGAVELLNKYKDNCEDLYDQKSKDLCKKRKMEMKRQDELEKDPIKDEIGITGGEKKFKPGCGEVNDSSRNISNKSEELKRLNINNNGSTISK